MGHDDDLFSQPLQRFAHLAKKVAHQSISHGVYVGTSLAQVLIFDAVEKMPQFAQGSPQGAFGIDQFIADQVDGVVDQHLVFENQQVGIDDIEMLTDTLVAHLRLDFMQLGPGLVHRRVERGDLGINLLREDPSLQPRHPGAVEQVGTGNRHPRRGADPDQDGIQWNLRVRRSRH